ncbi:hypothetical protein C6P45_002962 [Maudiozyma exigua]|uniref:WD-like domain-containing protein n=1 Tax=Maudiozyma exigua TaxID=34358 RepID=A0A9P7BC16_MAUEX|nr:hypothetical protein C6P45_002962 [Kazachstania exigua]
MYLLLLLFFYLTILNDFVSTNDIKPISYANILSNILNGDISTNNGVSALVNYTAVHPYGCTLNITFASLNNGQVVKDAVTLYEYALQGRKWGDALFFKHFILYNGQPHVYVDFPDLKYDLTKLLDGNETVRNIWIESSTDDQLKELYQKVELTTPVKNTLNTDDFIFYYGNHVRDHGNHLDLLS